MSDFNDYRLSADTSPEAEELYFKLLRKKSSAEKMQMVDQLNKMVRGLAITGLRERHPEDSEQELKVRLAELLYGRDAAEQISTRLREQIRDE